MEYEEATEATVTREEARREIQRHDSDSGFPQFVQDVGDRATYTGAEVLGWLGY